ncbi:hypothetical protein KC345_g216 [Hortaea werneckii]|nr:hypothetical protein KC345_g216 [Hortaea werneckii]
MRGRLQLSLISEQNGGRVTSLLPYGGRIKMGSDSIIAHLNQPLSWVFTRLSSLCTKSSGTYSGGWLRGVLNAGGLSHDGLRLLERVRVAVGSKGEQRKTLLHVDAWLPESYRLTMTTAAVWPAAGLLLSGPKSPLCDCF